MTKPKFKVDDLVQYQSKNIEKGECIQYGFITSVSSSVHNVSGRSQYLVNGEWLFEEEVWPFITASSNGAITNKLAILILNKLNRIELLLQNEEEKQKQLMKEYLGSMFSFRFTDPRTKVIISPDELQKLSYNNVWFDNIKCEKASYLWEGVAYFDGMADWEKVYASVPKPKEEGAYAGKYNTPSPCPAVVLLYKEEKEDAPLVGELFVV